MSEEILINISPMESRVALMDDGVLSDIYIERHNKLGLVGNIYLGTVVRVLPGMQAAFIDIGQQRTAFLHVNDMQNPKKYADNTQQTVQSAVVMATTNNPSVPPMPSLPLPTVPTAPPLSAMPPLSTMPTMPTMPTMTTEHAQAPSLTTNPYLHLLVDPHQPLSTNHFISKSTYNKAGNSLDDMTTEPSRQDVTTENTAVNTLLINDNPLMNNNLLIDDATTDTLAHHHHPNQDEETSSDNTIMTSSAKVTNLLNRMTTFTPPRTLTTVHGEPTLPNSTSKANKRPIKINPKELIQNRLHEGQRILVQVTKDELGTKGARLTTQISLPSRYLVYIPSSDHIGVSQRIDNETERQRLKDELSGLMQKVNLQGGIIARTAAEKIPAHKLEEDIGYLSQLWRMVKERQRQLSHNHRSVLIYQELSLPFRALRDLVHAQTNKVVVDDVRTFEELRQFAQEFVPMIVPKLALHQSEQALFDIHRVEEDLKDALKRRVELKSGGYLIIDQTEAMTTIDVNTGSYVGGRSLEDTVYKTNLEATHAIARQLRLRNLGGIIILDFIDMQEQEHKDDVLSSLQLQLQLDYAKTNITQVSELGLVEMTRKRTRESLEQLLCEPCSTCGGRGFVKTVETVCFEIFREIMRFARTYNNPKQFTVVAHASVIDLLLTSEADTVADLEYLLGRVITFEVEQLYTQEQYDIILD